MGAPTTIASQGFIEIIQIEWIGTTFAIGTPIDSGPVFVLGMSEIILSTMPEPSGAIFSSGQNPDNLAAVLQSVDGTNWDIRNESQLVLGNEPYGWKVPVVGRFARFYWTVRANPQTNLFILCYARPTRSDEECLS